MSKKVASGYLSVRAEEVLAELNSNEEFCYGYYGIGGKTPENVAAIKELKQHDLIEFWRGLMTDDGEVAGSGWCRSRKGNEYVEEFKL